MSIDQRARYADAEVRANRDASAIIQRLRVGVMGTDDFAYDKLASISMYLDRRLDSILEHASGNNAPTADN